MLLVNSPWAAGYERFWHQTLSATLGGRVFDVTAHEFVDQGLMALFFLVIGLEIKREVLVGELSGAGKAALPVIASIGGMVVPALVFLALNRSWPEVRGWAIPIATDVAFVLAAVALFGRRLPATLRVFLVAVAIVDNLGAIVVICVFYSYGIDILWLLISVFVLAMMTALNRMRLNALAPYLVLGLILWGCVLKSGVQATLAGALVAFTIPARPSGSAPLERLEFALHPWVAFGVLPLFALANAGVRITGDGLAYYMVSKPVALGIALGLLVAKPVGVGVATWIGTKLGPAKLPNGMTWEHVVGVSVLGGVGFTMSLLVASLAYAQGSRYLIGAKVAILGSSLVAGLVGAAILGLSARRAEAPAGD